MTKEFSRGKSQTLTSYLREFIFPYGGQTFVVTKVSPSEAGYESWDRRIVDPFVNEELEKLSSQSLNKAFPHYRTYFLKRGKKFSIVEPSYIQAELFPDTFACKKCRTIQNIPKREREKFGRRKPKCKTCGGPLAQFTVLLVCRNCGNVRPVPYRCPICKSDLKYVTRPRGAIEFECTNESCKTQKMPKKFSFLANIRYNGGCRPECNNKYKPIEGPMIQKPATSKIFKPFIIKTLQFNANEEIPVSLSREDIETFGFESITPGDLTVYELVLGYRRIAKFEDHLSRKRSEEYIYPFIAEGKTVVYGKAMITAGVEFKINRTIMNRCIDAYLKSPNIQKNGFKYMLDIVKKNYAFNNIKYKPSEANREATQRLLLHTFKHALMVPAPSFCGLDYGEISGFYKSDGMMGKGFENVNSPCVYIYDNTKYGSGVTFALISSQVFKRWISKAIQISDCPRNKCIKGACKACIFLPHTSCFTDLNRGLDREIIRMYLREVLGV